jgi:subtilisin family serine protease
MVDVASLKSGIDWIMHDIATNNTTGLTSVVNVSSNWSSSDSPKMLEVDMSTLASAAPGALIVQAAGNDYQAACSHAYAGTGPSPWMASIPRDGIMVVGAVNNHGQQVVPLTFFPFPLYMESPGAYGFWKNSAQFGGAEVGSNYGPCVDIWAPGDGIYMPLANPTVHIQNQDGTVTYSAYGFGSGTSFAAPHVAGLAAKLIETTGLTTPSAAESAVRANSYALTDPNGQSTKDVSSRAMNMVTLNGTHPSPSSKSYGEIYIQGTYQQGGVGRLLNSESINGFPTMPYTQTQAGVVTQHPFVVSFNSRGGGCTVNRQLLPSGSLILIGSANQTSYNIVGNPPSQEASAIDDWNPLNDGSQVWAASSDCFPNGTRVTN